MKAIEKRFWRRFRLAASLKPMRSRASPASCFPTTRDTSRGKWFKWTVVSRCKQFTLLNAFHVVGLSEKRVSQCLVILNRLVVDASYLRAVSKEVNNPG